MHYLPMKARRCLDSSLPWCLTNRPCLPKDTVTRTSQTKNKAHQPELRWSGSPALPRRSPRPSCTSCKNDRCSLWKTTSNNIYRPFQCNWPKTLRCANWRVTRLASREKCRTPVLRLPSKARVDLAEHLPVATKPPYLRFFKQKPS